MIFTQKLLGNSTNNNEEIASRHSSDQLGSFSWTFSLFFCVQFSLICHGNWYESFSVHLCVIYYSFTLLFKLIAVFVLPIVWSRFCIVVGFVCIIFIVCFLQLVETQI